MFFFLILKNKNIEHRKKIGSQTAPNHIYCDFYFDKCVVLIITLPQKLTLLFANSKIIVTKCDKELRRLTWPEATGCKFSVTITT